MKESLKDEIIAKNGDGVAQVVKERTKRSNPIVSTKEVAEALDISEEEALGQLEENSDVSGKSIGESYVWW